MPDGAARLAEIGVPVHGELGRPFRGIRYVSDSLEASGVFPDAPGWGIRRTALHEALRRRAEDVGVELQWGVKVEGLDARGFATSAGRVEASWLIGADGRKSSVRRMAGLAAKPARRRRFGVRRHFEIVPLTDHVEVHWADGAEAYVTPVSQNEVGVAVLWSGGAGRFDGLMERFPMLRQRLAGAPARSRDRGAGPLENRSRDVVRGNLALVGDASGYLDAISGEGLALAFHHSAAVVDAIEAGDLRLYRRAHRQIARYPAAVTHLLLLLGERPWLRRRVVRSLANDTALMDRFLTLKMSSARPKLLGSGGLIRLTLAALKA